MRADSLIGAELASWRLSSSPFSLRLVAYVLLGNHYHLVRATPDARRG
jgi:hypothetical protein